MDNETDVCKNQMTAESNTRQFSLVDKNLFNLFDSLTLHQLPHPLYRCRFSQMLHPIFEEASNIVREEFPDTKQVVFARVDCDQHCEYCFITFYQPFVFFLILSRKIPNNVKMQVTFIVHIDFFLFG